MSDSFPIEAKVIRWDEADQVGVLELKTGEAVRFGRTACKGFSPVVGMAAYVNDLGPHPLGGRKALLIRDEPMSEQQALERDAARAEAEKAEKLRPLTEAASKLPPIEIAWGFRPALDRIQELLPDEIRHLLRAMNDASEALADVGIEVSQDGSSPPWSFYDPSLWSFGVDGGGNVFALHLYPPALEAASRLPVVFWDHEHHTHFFQAEGLQHFLGQYLQAWADNDPESRTQCEDLAKRLDVRLSAKVAERLREDPVEKLDWPLPTSSDLKTIPLSAVHVRERDLVRKLIAASFEPEEVVEPLAGLDALYQELGWTHHLNLLRHQRADWFDSQERYLVGG